MNKLIRILVKRYFKFDLLGLKQYYTSICSVSLFKWAMTNEDQILIKHNLTWRTLLNQKQSKSRTLSLYGARGTFSNHSHCFVSLIYFFRYLVPRFIPLVVVSIFKFGYSFLFQRNYLSILFMQLKWKYDLIRLIRFH